MDFTSEELKLLGSALNYYERDGLAEEAKAELSLAVLVNADKSYDEKLEIGKEIAQKISTKYEQIVLLRAKLIRLKDKAFAEELQND
jgi:hypothetical protein